MWSIPLLCVPSGPLPTCVQPSPVLGKEAVRVSESHLSGREPHRALVRSQAGSSAWLPQRQPRGCCGASLPGHGQQVALCARHAGRGHGAGRGMIPSPACSFSDLISKKVIIHTTVGNAHCNFKQIIGKCWCFCRKYSSVVRQWSSVMALCEITHLFSFECK